jgi:hypothetical protein
MLNKWLPETEENRMPPNASHQVTLFWLSSFCFALHRIESPCITLPCFALHRLASPLHRIRIALALHRLASPPCIAFALP